MRYDSCLSILKAMLSEVGGSGSYHSNFELLIAILDNIGSGGGGGVVVELPATIDESTMTATFNEEAFNESTMTVTITNVEV